MPQIQIDVRNLSYFQGKMAGKQSEYHAERNQITEIQYSGAGKMADMMSEVNESCEQLMNELDELYTKIKTLLQCTEDGIVATDEFTAGLIRNRANNGAENS